MIKYDPDRDANPEKWLETPEDERLLAIERYHKHAHEPMPNRKLHSVIHVTVETQLAEGAEATVAALQRLRDAGLGRHEAIHAIGSVVAAHIFKVMKKGGAFDAAAYARDLALLTKESWLRQGDE